MRNVLSYSPVFVAKLYHTQGWHGGEPPTPRCVFVWWKRRSGWGLMELEFRIQNQRITWSFWSTIDICGQMSDPNTAEMQFCRKRTSQQDIAAKKLKIIVVSRIYSDALLTKWQLLAVLFLWKENILVTRGHWLGLGAVTSVSQVV